MERECNTCGIVKSRDDMVNDNRRPGTIGARCRDCHGAQVRTNKESRRTWHMCAWCGDERKIDKRFITPNTVCRKCQKDDVDELHRVRNYILTPVRRERYAFQRAKVVGRGALQSMETVARRVRRDIEWLTVLRPRSCANCAETFSTDSWVQIYCSKRCAKRAAKGYSGRFWISDVRRDALYERDGWICQLCYEPAFPWFSDDRDYDLWATLDHIVPRSLGGSDEEENLRLAHMGCNRERSNDVDWTFADAA